MWITSFKIVRKNYDGVVQRNKTSDFNFGIPNTRHQNRIFLKYENWYLFDFWSAVSTVCDLYCNAVMPVVRRSWNLMQQSQYPHCHFWLNRKDELWNFCVAWTVDTSIFHTTKDAAIHGEACSQCCHEKLCKSDWQTPAAITLCLIEITPSKISSFSKAYIKGIFQWQPWVDKAIYRVDPTNNTSYRKCWIQRRMLSSWSECGRFRNQRS